VAVAGVRVGPLAEDNDDTVTATLTVLHGRLHVACLNGVTVTGDDSATLTLSGSAAAVNKLLAGLIYTPTPWYEGCDTLHLSVTSSDGANTYPTAATASTAITRTDIDDRPTDFDAAPTQSGTATGGASPQTAAASAATTDPANPSGTNTSSAPDNSHNSTGQTVGVTGDGTAGTHSARQTFTSSPTKSTGGDGTFPNTAAGARPDNNSAANALNSGDAPTDITYEGSRSGIVNGGNGNDVVIAVFVADLLTALNGTDTLVHSSAAGFRTAQFDTITDFVSGPDKIDLTAFGSFASALLALTSTSTAVPAHTIAYDSEAGQTIVYVNPTGHSLSIGDTGLLAIHLPVATVHLSDFVLAPTKAAATTVAATGDPIDQAATTHNDATIVATASATDSSDPTIVTASTSDVSSDATVCSSAHLVDGNGAAPTTNIGDGCDAARDHIDSIDHVKLAGFDEGGTPSTEDGVDDAATTPPGGPSIEPPHAAATAPMPTSFVFDQNPTSNSAHQIDTNPNVEPGSGILKTPDSGSGNTSTASDAGEHAAPTHGAGAHDFEPSSIAQAVSGGHAGRLGDSFHFKDGISSFRDSGVVAAELNDILASTGRHDDAAGTHGPLAISEGEETSGTPGDSFHFKDEISSSKGSGVIDLAGLDQVLAPTSHHEDAAGARVPPAISDGAQAIELLPPEQQPNDHFNIGPHHAPSAFVTHVPHDLIV